MLTIEAVRVEAEIHEANAAHWRSEAERLATEWLKARSVFCEKTRMASAARSELRLRTEAEAQGILDHVSIQWPGLVRSLYALDLDGLPVVVRLGSVDRTPSVRVGTRILAAVGVDLGRYEVLCGEDWRPVLQTGGRRRVDRWRRIA